jgi:hypothetical protein
VALEAELSLTGPKERFDPLAHAPERSELERLVLAIGTKELGSAIGHPASNSAPAKPLSAMTVRPASGTRYLARDLGTNLCSMTIDWLSPDTFWPLSELGRLKSSLTG